MQNEKSGNPALSCLRCNQNSEEVSVQGNILVRIDNSAICSGCTKEINNFAKDVKVPEFSPKTAEMPGLKAITVEKPSVTPLSILNQLNEHVMGQEQAKKAMASVLANHYYRMQGQKLRKTNLLIIGPTGTGKTELARVASKILNVPFANIDLPEYSSTGYVGKSILDILNQLLQLADGDIKKAQHGIVFLDEVDKIADDGNNYINTAAVQFNLLKMLEGKNTAISRPKNKNDGGAGDEIMFDTSKILFIASGAFSDLDKIVAKDSRSRGSIGINANIVPKIQTSEELYSRIETKHLVQFGLMPEFLGRFQKLTFTQNLSVDSLVSILTGPKNSIIKHYKNMLKNLQIDVDFSDEFLRSIATRAIESGLGARGLERIFEQEMDNHNLLFRESDESGRIQKIKL